VGFVERGGVRVHWERWGDGEDAILFLPTWSIVHARAWKMQLPWFARRYRVLAFDPRGNGLSDRPSDPAHYSEEEYAADALAVLDATGTDRAALVGLSMGGQRGLLLATSQPERITAAVFIGPSVPIAPGRESPPFEEELDTDEGWAKYNAHYWRRDYPGFVEYFMRQIFCEPHSTKQIEDAVGWGLETDAETLIATARGWKLPDREAVLDLCSRVRCPVLVIHGELDAISPVGRGRSLAEATAAKLIVLPGSGHCPQARIPVKVNLEIEAFLGQGRNTRPRRTAHPRALFLSSPIGLGHAQRDLAMARELRSRRPELEIEWLAQHPVTAVLEAAGETIHPASSALANESEHLETRTGEHELRVFQAFREMDEILAANFMVFQDLVGEDSYDVWIGDEAWELDFFLHEHPELKSSQYVFLTDFVGWLPADDREAPITADYNAENIGHVEGLPHVRDAAVFVGEPDDLVPDSFGPELPLIRDWVPRHFDFCGYVLPFDPADYADTERLKRELGFDPGRPLVVGAVGGSGVGLPLLRRIAAGFAELRADVPDAELLLVCGPRIDPAEIEPVTGMRAVGYVHDLFRTLACCDLAVVQGGLTTTMELVANRRPFVYVPLRGHFEQNGHVAYRLARYGAPPPTPYDETSPRELAALMLERLAAPVDYRRVERGGAARAAELILDRVNL
jgi:pimeloyl-ACP methyl ester carboxylesterase/predicted glycosyltransferase